MKATIFSLIFFLIVSCGTKPEEVKNEAPPAMEEVTEQDMKFAAAHFSEQMVEYYLQDSRYSASGGIPVHANGNGSYTVDGIVKSHDGTGGYSNYSCRLKLTGPNYKEGKQWKCEEIYINGEKLKL